MNVRLLPCNEINSKYLNFCSLGTIVVMSRMFLSKEKVTNTIRSLNGNWAADYRSIRVVS